MHIHWDELETLEAVVRTGSVLAAGRELSLRHTSVSRRLAALERRLGAPLFLRGKRLRPTGLGLRIAERAAAMRSAAVEVDSLVAAHARGREERLVLTTNDVLAPLAFTALARVLPDRLVDVRVSDNELELAPGEVDLALRPAQDPSGALRGRRLGRLRLGIYRSTRRTERWILPAPSLRAKASMRWWREIPDDAKGPVVCDSLLAMRDACVAGLGRAILPSVLAMHDARLLLDEELDGGPPVWLLSAAAAHTDNHLRPIRDALHAALRDVRGAWRA